MADEGAPQAAPSKEAFAVRKLISEEAMAACVKVAGAEGQDVNALLGDEGVVLTEDEYVQILSATEDNAPAIKSAVTSHFKEFFQKMDEDNSGTIPSDAFKQVLQDLEGEYNMSFMTEGATNAIKNADGGKVDYAKFLAAELLTPREDDLL